MGSPASKLMVNNKSYTVDYTEKYVMCDWHPFYKTNTQNPNNFLHFNKTLEIINRIRQTCTVLSTDYERRLNYGEQQYQAYEIRLACRYHPKNIVESWGWVDMRDSKTWWPALDELNLLEKFGWSVQYIDI